MASICASCLRAMRQQACRERRFYSSRPQFHRISPAPVSTSLARRDYASQPQPKQQEDLSFTKQPLQRTVNPELQSRSESQSTDQQQQQPQKQPPKPTNDPLKNLASTIRQSPALKQTTEPYIAYGTTRDLLAECSRQISYTIPSALTNPKTPAPQNSRGEEVGEGEGWWFLPKSQGGLGLEVTFNSWAQVMFLYMYCLTVRLRSFPEEHRKIWEQQLLDHFFYAAEDRMAVWHNISTRGVRNKYLKDLWQQWRGVLLSYDEGLIKGDAVLAGAVWRNVFKGDEGVDLEDLALVTAFLRAEVKLLEVVSDYDISQGRVEFEEVGKFRQLVRREAEGMKRPFSNEEVGAARAREE